MAPRRCARLAPRRRNGDGSSARLACSAKLDVDDAQRFVEEATDLIAAVKERRYADALRVVLTSPSIRLLVEHAMAGPNASGGRYNAGVRQRARWLDRALRLLALTADMAEANSASGVHGALTRFAEPIGGWRGKHDGGLVVTLQGYAGFNFGIEWIRDTERNRGFTMSPSLSIGLQFSYSGRFGGTPRAHFYLSILDLANVLSVRIDEEDDQLTTTVVGKPKWSNLFSLGGYVGTSFGRSPVDWLAGCAYVPALRRDENDEPTRAVRCTLGIVVDVTIMRLR